jgi:predicted RNase H-like HicB family nuclease
MKKNFLKTLSHKAFPVFLEKDEDGVYVVECPIFSGCYSQGKTIDQALKKIKEVIQLCLEETDNQERAKSYSPSDISLHTVTI